ncbi:MAG: hypothetical protein DWI02_09880 [Planctomycetota bacterium]|nr:MAG: hypothetical protein DWI02_09880 [Planctomycetota bacterium]
MFFDAGRFAFVTSGSGKTEFTTEQPRDRDAKHRKSSSGAKTVQTDLLWRRKFNKNAAGNRHIPENPFDRHHRTIRFGNIRRDGLAQHGSYLDDLCSKTNE